MRTGLIVLVGTLVGASPLAASDTRRLQDRANPAANCQTCHRPVRSPNVTARLRGRETVGPGDQGRSFEKKMPPWFADPSYGHFANERRLTSREVETISAWVDGGAPAGKESDAPPPRTFENGWNLSPDIIVEMPKPFELPASGTINYKYVLVKTNFKDDLWVTAAEMRPGNSKVLHHGKVWVRPAGSTWMSQAVPGEAYERESHREVMGTNMIEMERHLGKFNPAWCAAVRMIGPRSSFRRDPISSSNCTIRRQGSQPRTCRSWASFWQRKHPARGISSTPGRRP